MNKRQQLALLIGIAALTLTAIFPPWLHINPGEAPDIMGYGPIWRPPVEKESSSANFLGFSFRFSKPVEANQLDWARLLAEEAVVAVVTGAALAILSSAENKSGGSRSA
ncbi:MAG: hypothetical protein K2X27_12765 [Candidatus Obscuribacterales bacterium]|nr:hypothetical protein [Candidatus Obscuribacterales bacterium]